MLKRVKPSEFIEKCKEELKKVETIKPPEWARYVKTGTHKQKPPEQRDWWYVRAASILRTIHLSGPVGVSRLRTRYGGKKDRGHKPSRFRKGSGSVVRTLLQQLEEAGLIEKSKDPKKKGRIVSEKGVKFLRKIAREIK